MYLIIIVQSVGSQQLDEHLVFHLCLGDIRKIDTRRVALELHIQTEAILFYSGSQVIHILHHQVPVTLTGIVTGVLQCLDEKCLCDIRHITGELSHLIGCTAIRKFISHGQYLVCLHGGI